MIKQLAQLECKIEEKVCRFLCDNDMPLAHVKECLCQFLKYIGNIEDAVLKSQESEKKPVENVNSEEQPKSE